MSYQGHFQQAKPPKKKKGKKIALIVLIVLLVIVLAGVFIGIRAYNSMLDKVTIVTMPTYETEAPATEETTEAATDSTADATTEETTVETTRPPMKPEDIINILVVGQSSRGGEEAALADTMILASVNTYTNKLTLTSFLRDTYVDLPDYRSSGGRVYTCGWNKLTSCYALGYSWDGPGGAMKMMNDCLYNNFGVEVDYNVEIDFDCFIKLVDILNGVGIEITQAEADYLNADDRFVYRDLQAGFVSLCGSEALSYARMRKAAGDNDSDIKRTERQRKLMDALFNNLRSMSFNQLTQIVNEILPMITTNMPKEKITEFLMEVGPMVPTLTFEKGGTCPVQSTYWSEYKDTPDGSMYVLAFDAGQNKKLMRQITEGEGLN